MKKRLISIVCLMLVVIMISSCNCNGKDDETTTDLGTTVPSGTTSIILNDIEKPLFTIVRPSDASDKQFEYAKSISLALNKKTGEEFSVVSDYIKSGETEDREALEILVGYTNRTESKETLGEIGYLGWAVSFVGKKIVICANTEANMKRAVNFFTLTTVKNGTVEEKDGKKLLTITETMMEIDENKYENLSVFNDIFAPISRDVQTTSVKTLTEIMGVYNDASGRIMTMAHRGNWREYPENSLPAIQSCIDNGIDIVEIDVQKTKDGTLVLCHDDTVDRTTSGKGKLSTLPDSTVLNLSLRAGKGGSSAAITTNKMPTLAQVFEICKGKIIINLDKCIDYKDDIYKLAEEMGCIDICMFKGSGVETWAKTLKSAGKQMPIICGSYWKNNTTEFISFINNNSDVLTSIESGFTSISDATASPITWSHAKTKGIRGVGITIDDTYTAGFGDDQCGWASLVDCGYSIIMTEYPLNLAAYIENISSIRDAKTPIRAENFNMYSGVSLSNSSGTDERSNKTVSKINTAATLVYEDVDFGSGLNTFLVEARSRYEGATVALRLDSAKGDITAVINLNQGVTLTTYAASFESISGVHDVYLSFEGLGSNLASLEYIGFDNIQ